MSSAIGSADDEGIAEGPRMKVWKAAAAAGVLAVLVTSAVTTGGTTASAASSGPDVRVGSFNVLTVSADSTASGERKTWRQRRATVVNQIVAQDLDVIGLQEANQSPYFEKHLVSGRTQYLDVLNGMNAAGGSYAVTAPYPYNSRNGWSNHKCVFKNRAASAGDRIIYNTETLGLLAKGAYKYPKQDPRIGVGMLAWAKLRWRATGQDFLFVTTHLDPTNRTVREAQWSSLISKVNSIKGSLPVVVTGDFNTQKFSNVAKRFLPRMVNNGYGDALGQRAYTNGTVPRPQSFDQVWLSSLSKFKRDATVWGYEQDRDNTRDPRTGNAIDWIFASNNLTIPHYEVVANVDPATLRLQGTFPSDHNLITATVRLP